MKKRTHAVGIAALFALALGAFGIAGVSAAATRPYTCVKDPTGTFFGAHCLTSGSGEKYKHVEIPANTQTTYTLTNANTAEETKAARSAILKTTVAGVSLEITCATVHGEGTLENKTVGEEMFAHAVGTFHLTGCEVKQPAGKLCKVAGETIKTEQLTGTSQGQGDAITFKPSGEGSKFTEIKIEGCSIAALNNTYPVTGSLKDPASGGTVTINHAEATTQATLKFGGQKAGIDGALTIKAHSKAGEETVPISGTT
ncbi:MAG TPA: hypothetical protein VFJ57_09135 [Solirubrobacterales bacterium]|nr:hypothetical protein [Solirubrobacterales bacterium]